MTSVSATNTSLTGTGRGKLILFGEHAVVFGSPAVGITLPYHTRVKYKRRNPTYAEADEWLQNIHNSGCISEPWEVDSNVPQCGGFGSSAALCVAVTRLVLGQNTENYRRKTHITAHQLEKIFHGIPSGLDTGLSSNQEGITAWVFKDKNEPPYISPLKTTYPIHLVYGAMQRSENTKSLLTQIRKKYIAGDPYIRTIIQNITNITESFIQLLANRQESRSQFLKKTSLFINETQKALHSLTLSSKTLDNIISLAVEEGAIAGKLSGAGAGGAFFFLVPDESMQQHLVTNLPTKLESAGIQLAVKPQGYTINKNT